MHRPALLAALLLPAACQTLEPRTPEVASTVPAVAAPPGKTARRVPVTPGGIPVTFGLPAPTDAELVRQALWRIWTTAYIVRGATAFSDSGAVPLLDAGGRPLGVSVSRADYCHGAVEGTLSVTMGNGTVRGFNFAKVGTSQLTDCSDIYRTASQKNPDRVRAWGRTLFTRLGPSAPFGTGGLGQGLPGTCGRQTALFRLVPHRSLAVDYRVRAAGTPVYIPALRGTRVTFPDGTSVTHDGYVLAADSGGSIRDNHVDYFIGPAPNDQIPPSIHADKAHPIDAYIVSDPEVLRILCEPHIQPL